MLKNLEYYMQLPAKELLDKLVSEYYVSMPEDIITCSDDMQFASKTLIKLSSNYSFLMSLLSYAKIKTRDCKRNASKQEYEDMVDKKEIIQNITDAVKQQYSSISRSVTIYIETLNELKMCGGQ